MLCLPRLTDKPVDRTALQWWKAESRRHACQTLNMSTRATTFTRLNEAWNAEPNAPDPQVSTIDGELVLTFLPNPFQFRGFFEDQRVRVVFTGAWRYRIGKVNDEGWYRGQCRFSQVAPAWGEFYEIHGDLRLDACPNDWQELRPKPTEDVRHFLFYFRDEEFECDAVDWRFEK